MKINIEVDTELSDSEVLIRCPEIGSDIHEIQKMLTEMDQKKNGLVFYKKEKEFYFPVTRILFFETSENGIDAHTADDVFSVHQKLYELEELLPSYFMRVAKSTILNTRAVYSVTRNLTASSIVEFRKTVKKVYVSRNYYKALKEMLNDKTFGNNRRVEATSK